MADTSNERTVSSAAATGTLSALRSAENKLRALLDSDHITIGNVLTDEEAAALLEVSRDRDLLMSFYGETCRDLLRFDEARETVRVFAERVRESADRLDGVLDGDE